MRVACLCALCFVVPSSVLAGSTLDAVRGQGMVRCAGVPRPGLAEPDGAGGWKGLEVEICRAIAVAALGSGGHIVFDGLNGDGAFQRAAADEHVVFVTMSEMLEHRLADRVLPGPTVFRETDAVMVAEASPVRRPEDLAGRIVCSLAGSPPDASLDAFLGAHTIAARRHPFSEQGEMEDAFRVGRCEAIAGEATDLVQVGGGRADSPKERLLSEPLKVVPILAATPLAADARWAAIVSWTIRTLGAADAVETDWRAGGLRALPIEGARLGLRKDWQQEILAAVGSYSSIVRRTIGIENHLESNAHFEDPPIWTLR